ncbi:MAG: hypothetical protein AB1Z98_21605, partial [Nannocystaceae bacterium]
MIAVLLLVLGWGLAGCGARPGVAVDRMQLGELELTLPCRVDALGVEPRETYRLHAEVSLPPHMRGTMVDLSIPLLEARVRVLADGEPVPSLRPPAGYRQPGPH